MALVIGEEIESALVREEGWLLAIDRDGFAQECTCCFGSKAGAEPRAGLDELASTDANRHHCLIGRMTRRTIVLIHGHQPVVVELMKIKVIKM